MTPPAAPQTPARGDVVRFTPAGKTRRVTVYVTDPDPLGTGGAVMGYRSTVRPDGTAVNRGHWPRLHLIGPGGWEAVDRTPRPDS